MRYKQWVKYFLVTVFGVITLFALFNYTIDPLWTFCHSNRYNNAQPGFNERQLKTNRAYFCGLEQYDALLLGSSRATYIDQHDFKGMKVFNYASVSMYPSEYSGWISQAKEIKGSDFKTIILGVDFFGSNNGSFGKKQMRETPKPSHYLDVTTSFLYRYKMLFSMDTLHKSITSIEHSKHLGTTDYTRDNIKQTIRISYARKQQAVHQQIALYSQWIYGDTYRYNTKLIEAFKRVVKENPKSDFIVFTTPISSDLFRLMVQKGRLPDYERWLTMLVEVFGEVYDFMGVNTITSNSSNYADLHHFYPEFGKLIADRITGTPNPSLPKDFGVLVAKKNLAAHLEEIEKQAKGLLHR